MRVLLDATALGGAPRHRGVGTYQRELLGALAARSDLQVAALATTTTALPAGVTRVPVRRGAPGRVAHMERDVLLPRELRRWRADVVHCPDPEPPRRAPAPLVQTLFDVIPLVVDDPALRARRRRWERHLAARYRRADAVVAISRHAADEGIRALGLDPARVRVAPLGVGAGYRPEGPVQRLEGDVPYVLVVGEHARRKGFADSFAVIGAVAEAGLPHRLAVAGRIAPWVRPELDRLTAAAPRADRIDLLGFVDDLAPWYRGASLVLVTSRYEGFGLPAAEAMACGTPVVAYANTALAEVVGDGGVLVADGDVDAACAAVLELLRDDDARRQVGRCGRVRARAFDWSVCAEAHAEAYRAVIN